jgi:tetratricopeptide (TPR) repeat protein
MNRVIVLLGILLLAMASNSHALEAVVDCGDPFNTPGRVGPWSYTDPESWREGSAGGGKSASRIRIVEGRHFTSSVRNLERGSTAVEPVADIAYTLEVIPDNHHALFAVARLHRKTNGTLLVYPQTNPVQFKPRQLNAPCWFERARRFAPKDPAVFMISGIFEHQLGEYPEAIEFYRRAEQLYDARKQDNAELYYNMALTYLKLQDSAAAKQYAEKAYAAGYPLPGLKYLLGD